MLECVVQHYIRIQHGRYQEKKGSWRQSQPCSSHLQSLYNQRSSKIIKDQCCWLFDSIWDTSLQCTICCFGSSTGGGWTPTGLRSPHSRPPKPESPSTPREDLMSQIKAKKRNGTWCFHGGRCQNTHKKLYNTIYIYLPAIITGDIHTQRLDGKRAWAGWMVCFLGTTSFWEFCRCLPWYATLLRA